MRLHIALLVLISVIAQIPQDGNCNSSVQSAEDTKLSNSQVWEHSSDPEVYREEYEAEPETNKRVRNRSGKRRRRLRPRPRTTTERPPDLENIDELHTAASSIEGTDNGEVTTPRRRTSGKRRRRPIRRYHDNEQPSSGRPRRRKGGRKRVRPPVIIPDDLETTTYISIDYESPATSKITSSEVAVTEKTTESSSESYYERNNWARLEAEILGQTQTTKHTAQPEHTDSKVFINEPRKGFSNYKANEPQTENTRQKTKDTALPENNDNKEYINELITPHSIEENTNRNENNTENEFGIKIFDRKALFSNSRKLPETSATLRRRLVPRIKTSLKNSTFGNHARIIKPLSNLESELSNKHTIKNEVITQMIPNEFPAAAQPEIIEPYQLINKIHSQVTNKELDNEEPNYPKLELFTKNKNKTHLKEEEIKENTTPTEYPITTTEIYIEMTTLAQNDPQVEIKQMAENKEPIINNDFTTHQIQQNINDEVLDLLKSETGNNRLQRILEIRNMTLSQLLDHRERGSSKFHLSDIFSKPQPKSKDLNKNDKNEINITESNVNNVEEENQTIKSSPEKILNTIPNLISENTPAVQVNEPIVHLIHSNEEQLLMPKQHRESRIFDSLPEFTSTKATPPVRPFPTWRIIPNPKLKPVSIRGDYKEIIISNVPTTHKSYQGNDIDKIFLLEDRENFINHRNKVAATISSTENRGNTFLFRKIPVSVKSAIVVSGAILVLAIFGFLSVLVSCRLRQKKARLRAKQDILCEHLQNNDDFMASQQSLSPVLSKHNRGPVFTHGIHSNTASNRHYYLWRTLRKTFQYD